MKTKTLYFRDGRSDKVYSASLDGNKLTLAWGRRGSTMQTKVVTGPGAAAMFEEKLAEKRAKGYVDGPEGTVFTAAPAATMHTKPSPAPSPMLLNEISKDEAMRLMAVPEWWLEPKHDGDRKLIDWRPPHALGYSRSGRCTNILPAPIVHALDDLQLPVLIDGEMIGDKLHAFDLLEFDSNDLRDRPYFERHLMLTEVFRHSDKGIVLVETAKTHAEKVALFDRTFSAGGEGVVLKNCGARYTAGRPNSGGNALKFKFVQTASVIVSGHHPEHSSVRMALYDGTDVGSVTIPPNKVKPAIGAIIEVRYLYAMRGGSLVQAVYLRERDDIASYECDIDQLKFKDEAQSAA